jgi:hypothetical protein
MSDIGALGPDILPVTILWNLEAVVLWELSEFHVAVGFFQGNGIFLVIDVGEPLEEQQREDVGLEVGRVDRTTKDIGSLPEVTGKSPDIQVTEFVVSILFTHSNFPVFSVRRAVHMLRKADLNSQKNRPRVSGAERFLIIFRPIS